MGGKKTGLGKSLIRDRFKHGKNAIINPDGSLRHTYDESLDPVNMKSVTQENDLEAFLTTATLAGTDFVAGT
jgi:large subunit GTPase 1